MHQIGNSTSSYTAGTISRITENIQNTVELLSTENSNNKNMTDLWVYAPEKWKAWTLVLGGQGTQERAHYG